MNTKLHSLHLTLRNILNFIFSSQTSRSSLVFTTIAFYTKFYYQSFFEFVNLLKFWFYNETFSDYCCLCNFSVNFVFLSCMWGHVSQIITASPSMNVNAPNEHTDDATGVQLKLMLYLRPPSICSDNDMATNFINLPRQQRNDVAY